jgi:RNA polymerase subunit RPABC4/transcription elongation factor Spt4
MMAVIILMALTVIYLFQKKLFSRDKLIEKRISKGGCQNCGKHLPANTSVCPFCGFEQFKQCSQCDKPTYVFGKFCKECGHSNG